MVTTSPARLVENFLKCGVFVREAKHRRLKISYRRGEQSTLEEIDFGVPKYSTNPIRLWTLVSSSDASLQW